MKICVGDFKIGTEEKLAVNAVLDKGKISESEMVHKFEAEFAKFIGVKYAIAVNSGTSALIASLTALTYDDNFNVKPKTNVITTPLTYIATSSAIVKSDLNPFYIDVDSETFGITPENLKAYLEGIDDVSKFSMVLPVHLMGYACDMDKINNIAKKYGLVTFEDSAQAHGTIYNKKRTGSLSLMSAFSFYIAHNIQAGEMGAIVTDNERLAKMARKIKAHGRQCDCAVCTRSKGYCPRLKENNDFDPRFTHDVIGFNFKTTEIQAALALSQLSKADEIIKKRQENVKYLNESLKQFSEILQLPPYSDDVSYLAYCIVIKNTHKISRAKLRNELEKEGVETRPLFGCIPTQQPAFAHLKSKYSGQLPSAEYLGQNAFYIGCHQYLTRENLDFIVSKFKSTLRDAI